MMKCALFPRPGAGIELASIPIPEPKDQEVRIKVYACGVCHTDITVGEGKVDGITYPRVPGHEVAGVIDVVGKNVVGFKKGDRVGVGFYGGKHCGICKDCLNNSWTTCKKIETCGTTYDGGFAEYMVAPQDALAKIPEDLDFKYAGPLMCAGVTVYNSMRNMKMMPGSLIAIHGLGGLGHLAVQYGNKMGMEVAAIGLDRTNEELYKKLGAHHYFTNDEAVEKLTALGGANLIVATAPHPPSIEKLQKALANEGKLLVLTLIDSMTIDTMDLVLKKKSIVGFLTGDPRDMEDTLKFSALTNVKPMIEEYPLEKVKLCMDKDHMAKAKFRNVLIIDKEKK
ncbi:hypothetical protein CYY_002411 [Polysphondylium violaceum]|uniref:Enoyl reductase (ER) domain-containing protein n=1 Tax=Polysphondylium violaceum TaxID=133409 RepID=A0A8J4PYH5_9MYCE|nr:hypothetical protein CYY_002411 [Polysphondylium violaceum]